jgi:hypothetical protein
MTLIAGVLVGCSSAKPEGCVEVSDALLAQIAEGTPEGGTPITPVKGAAYPSPNTDGLYYVGMEFTVDGDTEEGVWLVSSLEPGQGSTVAVSAMAQTVTQWPSTVNGTKFDITAEGAQESLDCIE